MNSNGDSMKICRLCLVEAEVMCPIFNSFSKSNPQSLALPQRIMSFAHIKVVENDGLPSSICYQCLAQVDKSYQFKLQCEQSDATLRQHLQEQEEYDSENGEWDMMITPEVILNEEEGNGDPMNESQDGESDRDSDSTAQDKDSSYPLSEVQALLRHHGTEIRLQPVNGGSSKPAASPNMSVSEHNGHARSAPGTSTPNGHASPVPQLRDFFPMYSVEAVLNNHLENQAFKDAHNKMGGSMGSLPPLLPRLPMTASLSSLLQRKGELTPELSISQNDSSPQRSRRSRDGEKLFKCRLCPKSYSFSSALSRHKAVHNTELRPYICRMCKKGFADPEKLERHMRTHVLDQTFPCDICGRVFKAHATYEKHKIMTQGRCRLFSCMMCGLGFPNKTKLKLHPCRAAHTDQRFPCPQCDEVLHSREAFETHIASHAGSMSLMPQLISLVTAGGDQRRSI